MNVYKELDSYLEDIVSNLIGKYKKLIKKEKLPPVTTIEEAQEIEIDDIIDTSKFLYKIGYIDRIEIYIWDIIMVKFREKITRAIPANSKLKRNKTDA